jgi:hypothetical protein
MVVIRCCRNLGLQGSAKRNCRVCRSPNLHPEDHDLTKPHAGGIELGLEFGLRGPFPRWALSRLMGTDHRRRLAANNGCHLPEFMEFDATRPHPEQIAGAQIAASRKKLIVAFRPQLGRMNSFKMSSSVTLKGGVR